MANPNGSDRAVSSHRRSLSVPLRSGQGHQIQESAEMAKQSGKQSHRTRHSRRTTRVQPDVIDQLDNIGDSHYHHEGPYDPACRERNTSEKRSPISALRASNEAALRATPRDKILDSILGHRPLDGVAFYPPGTTDRSGQTYNYEEGYNMMTEDRGNFRRWPGVKFREEDFKNDPWYLEMTSRSPKRRPWGFLRRKNSA